MYESPEVEIKSHLMKLSPVEASRESRKKRERQIHQNFAITSSKCIFSCKLSCRNELKNCTPSIGKDFYITLKLLGQECSADLTNVASPKFQELRGKLYDAVSNSGKNSLPQIFSNKFVESYKLLLS